MQKKFLLRFKVQISKEKAWTLKKRKKSRKAEVVEVVAEEAVVEVAQAETDAVAVEAEAEAEVEVAVLAEVQVAEEDNKITLKPR